MADQALAARSAQLEQAKALVEADASYFPQIVVGVLPVFDDPFVELRRWVADFVLLAMSSRKLGTEDKQELALKCLEKLSDSTANEQDITTAKSFIQITTIIYPIVFRHVANNPQSMKLWKNLSDLKSAILRFWDAEGEGLRICCVKFAQRVITAQSLGSKDPRLANKEDVSLNIVIADHPLLIERDLNAEAQALLDRIILVLQERPAYANPSALPWSVAADNLIVIRYSW
ncbi:Putative uncharacterized protein [Taphrina deformans PYCC 5710]|uniref:Symplekin/Pta1 N-terminal domain-containing protein n=1 Tax=Taphrina deformans (strain PYCC 5710 / ATCC 11124 / CBS 356.35 / IMI 108563 / JCM 9778 / NBRC 8474) TaxID=1097556 RepID=R4X8L3_TAPDE|nr:Putative uncharacterized protein [Taphrina deformans PYCC 5710]|eukprot:CCG81695.1 Putative uncharacterized protein [Taphrina deformans PYCC 5710]